MATEEEEAKAVRELQTTSGDSNKPIDQPTKVTKEPQTDKPVTSSVVKEKKAKETAQSGNNGSSGFDRLFCDEINEDFVEECMNLATALSQQVRIVSFCNRVKVFTFLRLVLKLYVLIPETSRGISTTHVTSL